jgi:DNA-binding XRE family transcriptional regulator
MSRKADARPPTVAQVLARTAIALRGDRKLELVARAAKSAGLNWGTGRVAELEDGKVSPTLPTLFALCRVFSDLLDRPVTLAELFAGDGEVTLNADTTIKLADLRAVLGGQAVGPESLPPVPTVAGEAKTRASFLEADARIAESLELGAWPAAELMHSLWGRSFSDERDRRGGPDASAQKLGRISRVLKKELQEAMSGDH